MESDRKALMNRISQYEFMLVELGLYLDSHKYDRKALAKFSKYRALAHQAREEYISKYGPLCMKDVGSGTDWIWTDDPWPWERKEC